MVNFKKPSNMKDLLISLEKMSSINKSLSNLDKDI